MKVRREGVRKIESEISTGSEINAYVKQKATACNGICRSTT